MVTIVVALIGLVGALGTAWLTYMARVAHNTLVATTDARRDNTDQHAATDVALELLADTVTSMRRDVYVNTRAMTKLAATMAELAARVGNLEETRL